MKSFGYKSAYFPAVTCKIGTYAMIEAGNLIQY